MNMFELQPGDLVWVVHIDTFGNVFGEDPGMIPPSLALVVSTGNFSRTCLLKDGEICLYGLPGREFRFEFVASAKDSVD